MDTQLLIVLLLVVIVVMLGAALFRPAARRRRRNAQPRSSSSLRERIISPGTKKHADYGALVASKHGVARSPEWGRVEKEHLLREPACVACGYKGPGLQVHHVKPFHLHPQLELDPKNLITLCQRPSHEHHLLLGHLGEWKSYNEHVRTDVKRFYRRTAKQIRADLEWLKKVEARP